MRMLEDNLFLKSHQTIVFNPSEKKKKVMRDELIVGDDNEHAIVFESEIYRSLQHSSLQQLLELALTSYICVQDKS